MQTGSVSAGVMPNVKKTVLTAGYRFLIIITSTTEDSFSDPWDRYEVDQAT